MRRRQLILLAVTAVGLSAVGGILGFLRPRPTAAERGQSLVRKLGCEGCHGPGGTGGVPNPGSKEREVPAFTGGTAMMYVETEADVRDWILDGSKGRHEDHPAGHGALLEMPAYRGRIDEGELDDLVAWYRAVADFNPEDVPAPAAEGRRVAAKAGCFGCHGPGGRIGAGNPGALKGYIPGWGSPDFLELVRDERELRAWIQDGICARLAANPAAEHFRRAAVIRMPAYRDTLDAEQVDALVAYFRWVAPALP